MPGGGQKDHIFDRVRAKLTGGTAYDGTSYFKMHDRALTQADADYLINNMKQDEDGYPTFQTGSTSGEDERRYQEWLIERYLEVPFREQTNEKIRQAEVRTKVKEIIKIDEETAEVAPVVEDAPQLVAVVEDKIDALEAIREDIAPPRSEYQPPEDPWGEGTIPPKVEATVKKTKKKAKKRKSKKSAPEASQPPKKKPFVSKMGGSVGKTKGKLNGVFSFMEKATPSGENQGPSVLAIGAFFGRKIQSAFDEAAEERARAVEAEENGAEIPPEMKEKGYFLKKSLGYQFGSEAVNKTLGAFAEDLPAEQSKKKAGFGDQFDYGDADPRKQKRQDSVKDLATGFRKVDRSLRQINSSLNKNAGILTQLVAESKRTADAAEAIAQQLAKGIDFEIETADAAQEAQQASEGFDSPINLLLGGKKSDRGILDILFALDDVRDIARGFRGNQSKGFRGRTNITGDISGRNRMRNLNPFNRRGSSPRITGNTPRFRFPRRFKFAEGAAIAGAVPAMVGEAGPEIVDRAGVSETLPDNFKPDSGLVSRFGAVMDSPMKAVGARVVDGIAALVKAGGPFSGVFATMFKPWVGTLSTVFGLKSGALAANINSAAMSERSGAKALVNFMGPFLKKLGIKVEGGGNNSNTNATGSGYSPGKWDEDPAFVAAINELAKKWNISGADILGLIASESSFNPQAGEIGGHYGLIQWSVAQARAAGTTHQELSQMSRVEQVPYIDKYFENNGLQKGASTGNLYAQVFLPAFTSAPPDSVVATSTGTGIAQGYTDASPGEVRGWYSENKGLDLNNDGKITINELGKRIEDKKQAFGITSASKGTSAAASFTNDMLGIFRMEGPLSGYQVPTELSGGKMVEGHGLEWLIRTPNKFVILPGVTNDYDVYKDPVTAAQRYKSIANAAGLNSEGMAEVMGNIIFGPPPSPPPVQKTVKSQLPMANVTPVPIPKDTATGTVGGQTVAIVQPSIQYVPVPGPVETVVETVPANVFAAARKNAEMQYLQSLS